MNKITSSKINESLTKMSDLAFPQYRKYTNDSSFFKIHSREYFEEVKKMPGGMRLYSFQARILPDRHYIMDMLECAHGSWSVISEKEYLTALQEVNSSSASK